MGIRRIITRNGDLDPRIEELLDPRKHFTLRCMSDIRTWTYSHPNVLHFNQVHEFVPVSSIHAMIDAICSRTTKIFSDLADMFMGILLVEITVSRDFETIVSSS